ncbi:DDB1- and CUL4-associated factor 13 [Entamoeba marina]
MSSPFNPNNFKMISRNVLEDRKELPHDIEKVHRSLKKEDHPLLLREYRRALNAVKLDKIFAKPFIEVYLVILMDGGYDGEVRLWNASSKNCLYKIQAHDTVCKGISYSTSDVPVLITVSTDHTAKLWPLSISTIESTNPATVTTPLMSYNFTSPFSSVSSRYHDTMFCTGSSEGLELWSFDRSECIKKYDTESDGVLGCKFSPTENNLIAITGGNRSISLYDIRTETAVATLLGTRRYNDLSWNPMQAYHFVACSDDWSCYTYDVRYTKSHQIQHTGHLGPVLSVDFSPTGKEFSSGSYDKTIRLFNSDRPFSRDCYHTQRMQNGDAHYVFTASEEGNIRVWRAFASVSDKIKDKREVANQNYLDALKKKYAHMPEIRKISNHKHLPKELMLLKTTNDVMKLSEKRKNLNRLRHAKKDKSASKKPTLD